MEKSKSFVPLHQHIEKYSGEGTSGSLSFLPKKQLFASFQGKNTQNRLVFITLPNNQRPCIHGTHRTNCSTTRTKIRIRRDVYRLLYG